VIRKSFEKGIVKTVELETLFLKLHNPQHRFNQDTHRDSFMLVEHVGERTQHKLSDVVVVDVFNKGKGEKFVNHRGLVVSALSKLV
jgi:hypothetical protein